MERKGGKKEGRLTACGVGAGEDVVAPDTPGGDAGYDCCEGEEGGLEEWLAKGF